MNKLVTLANGTTVSAALPFTATLSTAANSYTVTNTVTCTSKLTLVKQANGSVPASAWTLTATAPTGALAGPVGTTGVSADVTPNVQYVLAESGGSPNYVQRVAPNAVPIPGSTVSWNCVEVDSAGIVIPGFADGLNGGVTVPYGTFVRCTSINDTATLRLAKAVVNDHGGTATAADWQLTATPLAPVAPGLTPVTVTGSTAGTAFEVRPGQAYQLTESGLAGYTPRSVTCAVAPAAPVERSSITLDPNDTAVCVFTNNDQPARLTLVKQVENGTTGATATPANWTLAAGGPTPISGVSGTSAVTNAPVSAAATPCPNRAVRPATRLRRGRAPAPRSPTAWSRSALGQSATCTIVNTAIAPRLTLVKQVVNTSGGTALPTAWTLSATGTVTISGHVGDPTVTAAEVPVGHYTLAETGGPAGYTGSSWSCTGASAVDTVAGKVTLAPGNDATCTITNTDQPAKLTLAKVVDPAASGSGKTPADWQLTATPVSITGQGPVAGNGDPTSAGGVNAVTVFSGSYDLSESGPAGFAPGSWTCQGAVVTDARVAVPPGGAVQCTITNTAVTPRLTLVKVVDNGSSGATTPDTAWTLTATGPTPISGTTGTATVTAAPVHVGTYTLSETGPLGYLPSDWVCTGAAAATPTSVTLAEGQAATCTITNTVVAPQLTLVKMVNNGTTGGTAAATDWTLAADGPSSISGVTGSPTVTAATVKVGPYRLSESGGPGGYTASAWSCVGGTPAVDAVSLAPGDRATCTITNTAITPTLTLVKAVDNGTTGATAVATDWTLAADGPTPLTGPSGSPAVTAAPVQAGAYALSESGGPSGYSASTWSCVGAPVASGTVTIALGQNAICTITNTAVPPTLTLVKQVVNTSGGAALAADWLLSAAGPVTIQGHVGEASVTTAVVPVGSYTLAEAGPPGYTTSPWACTGAASTDPATAEVVLAPGNSATCTVTNTDQPAQLTLVKVVDAAASGSGKVAADWTLTATPVSITGQGPVTGNGDPTSSGGVNAVTVFSGSYDLTETGPAGFDPGAWSCEGAVVTADRVVVPPGGVVRCSITNTAVSPTLTLVKMVDNGTTGATTPATEWTLTADGPTPISGATGAATVTTATVQVGTYTLSESGPAGYTASDWSCTGGTSATTDSVTVAEGQHATCTITNTAIPPKLTLVKQVDTTAAGGSGQPTDWTLTAAGPTTVSGSTGDPSVTAVTVPVGAYTLSESGGPAGYTASPWSCVGGTAGTDAVTLAPGDDATCTVTNTAVMPKLTLVKVVDNGATGATAVATDWTLSGDGPVSISGVSGSGAVTGAPVQVGQYTLAETGPGGYTASDWTCTGAASTTSETVTVTEGQDATCTITNTAIPPTLTLVKAVVNNSGGTAVPTDWILTASGPTTLTGRTGEPAVTGAVVPVGSYQLTESAGDPGYAASVWVCTGNAAPVSANGRGGGGPRGARQLHHQQHRSSRHADPGEDRRPGRLRLREGGGRLDRHGDAGDDRRAARGVGQRRSRLERRGRRRVGQGRAVRPERVRSEWLHAGHVDVPGRRRQQRQPGDRARPRHGHLPDHEHRRGPDADPRQGRRQRHDGGDGQANRLAAHRQRADADQRDDRRGCRDRRPGEGRDLRVSESGPTGYTASAWSCVGATVAAGRVTLAEGQSATCTIKNTAIVGIWTLAKTSNPPSGSSVPPGSKVTYTLTATHRSGSAIVGAVVVDNLSKVLPFASLDQPLATGLHLSGQTLTWTVPTIPVGGSVKVSYSVTVLPTLQAVDISNVAAVQTAGGSCGPCSAVLAVTATPPPVTPPPTLPVTGVDAGPPLRWSGILLLSGAALIAVSFRGWRRWRRARVA